MNKQFEKHARLTSLKLGKAADFTEDQDLSRKERKKINRKENLV